VWYHGPFGPDPLDVAVAHVAEDAAQQHVGGQCVGEAGHQARVGLADLNLGQALPGRRPAGQATQSITPPS